MAKSIHTYTQTCSYICTCAYGQVSLLKGRSWAAGSCCASELPIYVVKMIDPCSSYPSGCRRSYGVVCEKRLRGPWVAWRRHIAVSAALTCSREELCWRRSSDSRHWEEVSGSCCTHRRGKNASAKARSGRVGRKLVLQDSSMSIFFNFPSYTM